MDAAPVSPRDLAVAERSPQRDGAAWPSQYGSGTRRGCLMPPITNILLAPAGSI